MERQGHEDHDAGSRAALHCFILVFVTFKCKVQPLLTKFSSLMIKSSEQEKRWRKWKPAAVTSNRSRKWGQMSQKWIMLTPKVQRGGRKMKNRDMVASPLLLLRECSALFLHWFSLWWEALRGSQQLVLIDLITWVVNLQCDCTNGLRSSTSISDRGKGQRRWRAARLIEGLWALSWLRLKAQLNFSLKQDTLTQCSCLWHSWLVFAVTTEWDHCWFMKRCQPHNLLNTYLGLQSFYSGNRVSKCCAFVLRSDCSRITFNDRVYDVCACFARR